MENTKSMNSQEKRRYKRELKRKEKEEKEEETATKGTKMNEEKEEEGGKEEEIKQKKKEEGKEEKEEVKEKKKEEKEEIKEKKEEKKEVKEEQQQEKPLTSKERRLLKRQLKREEKEKEEVKEEVQEEVQEEPKEEEQKEKPLTAKERRLLKQRLKREAKEKKEKEEKEEKSEESEKNKEGKEEIEIKGNSKERRKIRRALEQKKKEEMEGKQSTGKREKTTEKKKTNAHDKNIGQKIHRTLFLGQLSFKTTVEQIRQHFAEVGEMYIRPLTDKKTKRFRGIAFLEVKDVEKIGAALSKHHTLLNGRRINVELTANGGGCKSELRKQRIQAFKTKQKAMQSSKAKALLETYAANPECPIEKVDIDDRLIDFLSWFDYNTAKKAIEEFADCYTDKIKNKTLFFMGILKRYRATDGVEDDREKKRKSYDNDSQKQGHEKKFKHKDNTRGNY